MLLNSRDEFRRLWAVRLWAALIVIGFATLSRPTSTFADPEECQEAIDAYNTALRELPDAIQAYANCVASSHGHDDCSVEFSNLRSDQDDFETAVANYQRDCQ